MNFAEIIKAANDEGSQRNFSDVKNDKVHKSGCDVKLLWPLLPRYYYFRIEYLLRVSGVCGDYFCRSIRFRSFAKRNFDIFLKFTKRKY